MKFSASVDALNTQVPIFAWGSRSATSAVPWRVAVDFFLVP